MSPMFMWVRRSVEHSPAYERCHPIALSLIGGGQTVLTHITSMKISAHLFYTSISCQQAAGSIRQEFFENA